MIALAVPGECRDRYELAEVFSVTIGGRAQHLTEIDVDDLLNAVRDRPAGQRLSTLRSGRIQ